MVVRADEAGAAVWVLFDVDELLEELQSVVILIGQREIDVRGRATLTIVDAVGSDALEAVALRFAARGLMEVDLRMLRTVEIGGLGVLFFFELRLGTIFAERLIDEVGVRRFI